MTRIATASAALVLAAAALSPNTTSAKAIVPTVSVTFRLQVAGTPAHATFWVAYGPLAGKFGLVRLQPRSGGLYAATRPLPATGRTTFAYLMGRGAVRTRAGLAPGNPVVTIRSIGPTTAAAFSARPIERYEPVG